MNDPMIEISDLRKSFGENEVLKGVNLRVNRGETVVVMGRSGCGKSVLLKHIIGLMKPDSGRIVVDGIEITALKGEDLIEFRKRFGMLFQGAALFDSLSVWENVGLGLLEHTDLSEQEVRRIAREKLELVGLTQVDDLRPSELSGGMKQRAFIAMALALNPDLIICDEPTTALDVVVQAQILNLLKQLQEKFKMSIIIITHDLGVIAELADDIAIMYAGKIVEKAPSEKIFLEPAHPYTRGLISSVPRLTKRVEITWIPGLPPDLANPPSGCRFHPRCKEAMDICKKEEPPIVKIGPDHEVACWLYG